MLMSLMIMITFFFHVDVSLAVCRLLLASFARQPIYAV